jgi:hypothetical protein
VQEPANGVLHLSKGPALGIHEGESIAKFEYGRKFCLLGESLLSRCGSRLGVTGVDGSVGARTQESQEADVSDL